jgi:hypothetical protein
MNIILGSITSIFLSSLIVIYLISYKNGEIVDTFKDSGETCEFIPSGKTKSDCIKQCRENDNKCSQKECELKCEKCEDTECTWVTDKLKPMRLNIKMIALKNGARIIFNAPKSDYYIHSYIIVLQDIHDPETKSFLFPKNRKLNTIEYEITDLSPSKTYDVYAIARNRFGNSPKSNRIRFSPLEKGTEPKHNKPAHEIAYDVGEYKEEDFKEVLTKVLDERKLGTDFHFSARY